jgi:hypothetical protein
MVYHAQADRPSGGNAGGDSEDTGDTGSSTVSPNDTKGNVLLYPNPAKTEVTVSYKISKSSPVGITLKDMTGKQVYHHQSNGTFPEGTYEYRIPTERLTSGIYLLTVETSDYKETKKLVIK